MYNFLNVISHTPSRLALLLFVSTVSGIVLSNQVQAHGPTPLPLKGVPVPITPGLLDGKDPIVVNKTAAITLGKALFWDTSIGSDGMACASCHFHAGADRRIKNQLTTGVFHLNAATANTFEATASGKVGAANYTLKSSDFPLHQLSNPSDKKSAIIYDTDDVVASSGAFSGTFQTVNQIGSATDQCQSVYDPVYHIGNLNSRRVEPRNTPTVINAAFNFRNFWDGRANNIFNGTSPFGLRDKKAAVWVMQPDGSIQKTKFALTNASLASQAMAPALSDKEMSCAERTFPELGRKLLARRPLEVQVVHQHDSVLAATRHNSGKGLNTTYAALIKKSFAPRYWAGQGEFGLAKTDTTPYNQMEANFSLFFGLALQLYQETLISDQTPFDTRDAAGIPTELNAQQTRGLTVFLEAHCAVCHKGPTLSAAAHPDVYSVPSTTGLTLVNRKTLKGSTTGSGVAFALMDEGFANTSVTPSEHDAGIGDKDPFGNPLSYTEQYVKLLQGKAAKIVDGITINACAMDLPFSWDYNDAELIDDPFGKTGCVDRSIYAKVPSATTIATELSKPEQGRMLAATNGAFKIPSLRNVELTGPYMHNGSMKTLEEVVEFYNRGGNFDNPHHFGTLVFAQGLNQTQKEDLVAFLKSLTDERVRWEKAPFDHPQLLVPHGHAAKASTKNPDQAQDQYLSIMAVGKEGRNPKQGPLQPFEYFLKP
jgi:cytochrome c peroxidase